MIRWFSIGVITYLIIGISWWGLLLYKETTTSYRLSVSHASNDELPAIEAAYQKDKFKIYGEGVFLGLSILAGVYIIYRSAQKEIQHVRQQGDFLLSVSHELKSPIAAMKLALQTLHRPNLPADMASKITASAIEDAERLDQLVQNILLSASIDEKHLELYTEAVEIQPFLNTIVHQWNSTNTNTTPIHLTGDMSAITCHMDQLMMRQALTNILQNARKYAIANSVIGLHCLRTDHYVRLSIANYGPVIQPEEREKIFERFYRSIDPAIRSKEGTGIGLYISKEIIHAHQGRVYVAPDGAIDKTTFVIELPIDV